MDVEEACGKEIMKVRSWRLKIHRWEVKVHRMEVKVDSVLPMVKVNLLRTLEKEFLKGTAFVAAYSIPGL